MTQKDTIKKILDNIEKVVINTGLGRLSDKPNFKDRILPSVEEELAAITGQISSKRPAKKSIAGFSVREGDTVGLKTTLRGKRMADFIIRITQVAMPRVRDFKGIDPKNIDEYGNLNIGFKDQSVFPEIDMEKSNVDFGFQITLVPNKMDRGKAIEMYKEIGVPLKKD